MHVYRFASRNPEHRPAVLTIGNFDGVHLGHQALLRRVVAEAHATDSGSAVLTFDPHPQQVLKARTVPLLSTLPLRLRLFEQLGLDAAYIIPFTRELARLSAEQFMAQYLLARFDIRRLVIGYDFAFGRNRAGTAEVLEEMAGRWGFSLEVFPAVAQGEEVVSSTRVREALAAADFGRTRRLLGRPYSVLLPVERGERRGHALGFPTINQPARQPLPIPYGIYASRALVAGHLLDGVSNYGVRPTVNGGDTPVLETYLFGFSGELYDRDVEVMPLHFLRPEERFADLEALREAIAGDCRRARDWLAAHPDAP